MASVEQYARAHVRGCGGTGEAQDVLVFLGSGTDGQEAGLQQSLLMLVAQKLLVYKRGIHKCLVFVLPAELGRMEVECSLYSPLSWGYHSLWPPLVWELLGAHHYSQHQLLHHQLLKNYGWCCLPEGT